MTYAAADRAISACAACVAQCPHERTARAFGAEWCLRCRGGRATGRPGGWERVGLYVWPDDPCLRHRDPLPLSVSARARP